MAVSDRVAVDVTNWNRREIYRFFSAFSEPFYGMVAEVDVTRTYTRCKGSGESFFLTYLHRAMMAVNALEPFRLRIEDGQVNLYGAIHSSATINRDDGTFGFSFIVYDPDYEVFKTNALAETERIRNSHELLPPRNGQDAVHCSSIPWVSFTSISHARHYGSGDTAPKISFGKMTEKDDKLFMPCSVHVHHALVDGKDVGDFYRLFQEFLDA